MISARLPASLAAIFALSCSALADEALEFEDGGPEATARAFVNALDALDLSEVMATFAEDGSLFFPHPNATWLAVGKDEIHARVVAAFEQGKAQVRAAGISGPPYLGIIEGYLESRRLTFLGDGFALVTWTLDRPGNFGRRSAVLRLDPDRMWRVVHLHSSNLLAAPNKEDQR
jgi:hypothetical protein